MDGVIVGSDQTLEWILPWWLEKYLQHNSHPVAFIDLGLSFEKKKWCREYGELIPLRVADFAEEAPFDLARQWEEESGKQFLQARDAWFKKPLACLKSPFDRTLWIDIDCEIKGSLSPLFKYEFAMARDFAAATPYPMYNSGVIAFCQNHPLLNQWAKASFEKNRYFRGDQELFSSLIHEKQIKIEEIPPQYNWSRLQEDRPDIIVHHWHGHHGKFVIRSQFSQSAAPPKLPPRSENEGEIQVRENPAAEEDPPL